MMIAATTLGRLLLLLMSPSLLFVGRGKRRVRVEPGRRLDPILVVSVVVDWVRILLLLLPLDPPRRMLLLLLLTGVVVVEAVVAVSVVPAVVVVALGWQWDVV